MSLQPLKSGETPSRLREEGSLLVYDADVRLTVEELESLRRQLLAERELDLLPPALQQRKSA